jgi:hypothetical protein
MNPKEKARERAAHGLRNREELPGNFNSHNSPETENRQRNFVARRFGFAPHVAAVVAALAFERRASQ